MNRPPPPLDAPGVVWRGVLLSLVALSASAAAAASTATAADERWPAAVDLRALRSPTASTLTEIGRRADTAVRLPPQRARGPEAERSGASPLEAAARLRPELLAALSPTLAAAAPALTPPAAVVPVVVPVAVPTAAPAPAVAPMPAPAAVAAVPTPAPPASSAMRAADLPGIGSMGTRRFDLSVNNAPASQVFLQMVQGTSINMLVPPDLSGTVSISLRDVTLVEALESMRDLYGYDFRITGNRVLVQSNAVQTRLFRVNYLPGRRQGSSDVRITSSSISQAGTGSNGAAANNGNSGGNNNGNAALAARPEESARVRTTSDADFWREVTQSLNALVGAERGRGVVINPAAGVIVVKATPADLRQVEQYLNAVQLSIERQVMLEAKIVQVSLSKEAQTGINWGSFARSVANGALSYGVVAPGSTLTVNGNLTSQDATIGTSASIVANALGKGFYGLAFQSASFAALLNFLQTQGDVSVLSSPRIATLNNQKAVLKVGSDELYVTGVTTNTTTSGTSVVNTPTLQLQPFFSGIALDVTPQIDDTGKVILHVHPTISVVAEKQKNIDLGSLGQYRLPLAASTVNETDSIVRVADGQIVAIGGLMQQEVRDERSGVPVLSEVPVFGGLFRQSGTVNAKRELVILIKPTVVREDGLAAAADPVPPAAPTR
ncbi:MAG: pilus (MSHA type) biogenesis protein MshL [Rubrivivax sp.]